MSDLLREIYYSASDSGSYGGIDRLLKRARESGLNNVTRQQVAEFLRDQQSYSLHKPARKHFRRNPIYAGGIDRQWQADLADMQGLVKANRGHRYILTVIDVFSKYAWALPVKGKSAAIMGDAMRTLFEQARPRKPRR